MENTKDQTTFEKSHDIDYKLLDNILSSKDLTKMSMMDVVKHVYEATFMYFSLMYYEAKKEEQHVTEVLLKKNKYIDELESEIATLRERLPEESPTPPEAA